MDTKLTKFNSRFIVKSISVLLILLTIFVSSNIALSCLDKIYAADRKLDAYYTYDAAFDKSEDGFYTSVGFIDNLEDYLADLLYYSYIFSDTTGKSFAQVKTEINEKYEKYKYYLLRFLYSELVIQSDGDEDAFSLIASDIITLKRIGDSTKTLDDIYLDYNDNYENIVWNCCVYGNDIVNEISSSQKQQLSENIKSANKIGADLILDLPNICYLSSPEDDFSMKSGKYAITLNEDLTKQVLSSRGAISELINYDSFKEAKESFSLDQNYKNINYIVKTDYGDVFTNVKDYKSVEKDLNTYLSQFTYSLTGSGSCFTSNYGTSFNMTQHCYSYGYDFDIYSKNQVVPTTSVSDVISVYGDDDDAANNRIKVKSLTVFFNDDAVFMNDTVSESKSSYYIAGKLMRNFACLIIINLLVFGVFISLLIALSGKRQKSDEEIHLLPTDKIPFEIRLILSFGLIFLLGYYVVWGTLKYNYISTISFATFLRKSLPYAAVLIIAILIDFILYFTRIIKGKRLRKSSLIYLILKLLYSALKWCLKLIYSLFKWCLKLIFAPSKNFFSLIKNIYKAKKANNIKEAVITKSILIACINAVLLLSIIIFAVGKHLFTVFILLVITGSLDAYMILRSLKFVGGVDKLLEILHAYRSGELEFNINRKDLPDYLIPAADDLREIGDGIKLAVDEAVKQETTKTELITNISHDLKTPLTSIINYVELLKSCDLQNDTARSYLEVLGEKSDRLKHLICDLVEASKAATGNVEVSLVNVSLKEIIAQIVGEHSEDLDKKQLSVICDIPENDISVKADSKLLYRVLENLIGNVSKYAMPQTRVYISADETDNMGTITIKNISAAPLNITPEQLKQRFVRGDQARTTEGNGLGLSIAENLCTVQGGKLEIEIMGDLFIARVELNKIS